MCEKSLLLSLAIIDLGSRQRGYKYQQRSQGGNPGRVSSAILSNSPSIELFEVEEIFYLAKSIKAMSSSSSSSHQNVEEGGVINRNREKDDERVALVVRVEEEEVEEQDSTNRGTTGASIQQLAAQAIVGAAQSHEIRDSTLESTAPATQSLESQDGAATPSRSQEGGLELRELEELQATPKGEEHRIPEPTECPPAPRKLPRSSSFPSSSSLLLSTISSSSSRKRSAQQAFFVPPDSEVFAPRPRQEQNSKKEEDEHKEEKEEEDDEKNTKEEEHH
ncbi:hypothetical protein SELMODRAFT_409968 [Selaginella moellendorffii]|uniref:Uncharacterized protein SMR2b n=1 Tax=Selaginella moellendorffii TaxID=88036 RepID=D8RD18_SELML|nr:uncharacterized protein LOC9651244 [Selaginella moellendorffii]EFJ29939.1 hypothetical protein SELMODRAFT_409968 [Selaginella moellendorffii]|eukprot:XP_002968823.1 uncharacterized protein LOC9651244 [Selaginella moellendorffii]